MNKKTAIVMGSNYSTALGVIRSLGEGGYDVCIYAVTAKHNSIRTAALSRYVKQTIQHHNHNDQAIVEELISSFSGKEKPVILPTDDYTAVLLGRNQGLLRKHFSIPYLDHEQYTVEYLMDKSHQYEIAERFGLKIAKCYTIRYADGGYEIPDDLLFPCFLKPLLSIKGGKNGMLRVDTREELQEQLDVFLRNDLKADVLLQQYLDIKEEYSMSGICMGNTVIIPALLTKIQVAKRKPGVTIFGRVDRLDRIGDVKDKLFAMMGSLHYYGLFDLELFRCSDGYYFNEINFRSSSVCYIVTEAGMNLPAAIADFLRSGERPSEHKVAFGKYFISEKPAYEDRAIGYISKRRLAGYLKKADYFLMHNDNDSLPEKFYIYKRVRFAASWKIRSLIKKAIGRNGAQK